MEATESESSMSKGTCASIALVLPILVLFAQANRALAQTASLRNQLTSDFKYVVNNTANDVIDVVTAPLNLKQVPEVLSSPKFYIVLAGAGAVWGGSFALDQTMRSHLRSMSSSDADALQDSSYASVATATALLYGYGLYKDDDRARQYAITGGMGAGVATLLNIGIKAAFGRLRPSQSSSHTAFFDGGQSFVSGDVTPLFGFACGISEYYHNAWYVAAPVYSLALLDGFGRMGNDAHWFSDVVGAALLGVGTTELLLWLHKKHELDPDRFRIFAINSQSAPDSQAQSYAPVGAGMAFSW
jgi:membrane-associated phospholipid phosphatase